MHLFLQSLTGEAGFANTVIAVDAIFADAIVARVTGAIVKVYFTVRAWIDDDRKKEKI